MSHYKPPKKPKKFTLTQMTKRLRHGCSFHLITGVVINEEYLKHLPLSIDTINKLLNSKWCEDKEPSQRAGVNRDYYERGVWT